MVTVRNKCEPDPGVIVGEVFAFIFSLEAITGGSTVGEINRIFISWSGEASKIIARKIKSAFEDVIFNQEGLCFVSEIDIASGTDWYEKIRDELASCKLGISIITRGNMLEPWIYFEAGALISNGVAVIPLIFEAQANLLKDTPLASKQAIKFADSEKFCSMICDINRQLGLTTIAEKQLNVLANSAHADLCAELRPTLDELRNKKAFNEANIYPKTVRTINKKSMYISVPMESIDEAEYQNVQIFLQQLNQILRSLGYRTISPALEAESKSDFDYELGAVKAIKNNFRNLKQTEYILVIYPHSVASSLLLEIGYGIALTKCVVIFHKEKLPYILSEARGNINHVMTIQYSEYDDIIKYIKSNGIALFCNDLEEE